MRRQRPGSSHRADNARQLLTDRPGPAVRTRVRTNHSNTPNKKARRNRTGGHTTQRPSRHRNTNRADAPAGTETHSAHRTHDTYSAYGNEKKRGTQSTPPFQNATTRSNTRPHSGSRDGVSAPSYSCGSRRRCLRQASRGSGRSSNGARHQTLHLSERDTHESTPTRAGLNNRP